MKKLIITTAIILGLGLTTFAQSDNHNGGVFQRGAEPSEYATREGSSSLMLPAQHGQEGDQGAPVGSGIIVLVGLGAAYLVAQRRKER